MAITTAWDETTPAGTDAANTADDEIVDLKVDVREQLNDGNHDDISVNTTTGARHVASDADDEFPIYSPDDVSVKYHGFGNSVRHFGDGVTRANHVFEYWGRQTGLGTGTLITITPAPNAVYRFVFEVLCRLQAGATGVATDYFFRRIYGIFHNEGGTPTILDETTEYSYGSLAATPDVLVSGSDIIFQVGRAGTAITAVGYVRAFRNTF